MLLFYLTFLPLVTASWEVDPEFGESSAAKAAVALSVIVSILFGVYVLWYYQTYHKRRVTNEEFVTAKDSAGRWSIAWSFYASAVGSWVLTGPADLAFYSGLISVFAYGFAVGFPPILIAYFGETMQKEYPEILSLSDFVDWRFGRATQAMVVVLTLFNMSVAAASEYTTIAAFFATYVGLGDFNILIVLTISVITLGYTAYGGLVVSILTDRIQAVASVIIVIILSSYILATLQPFPPPEDLEFCVSGENETVEPCSITFAEQLYGTTEGGYSTIFTLPLSLICATVYSEALWQRAWASESPRALRFGAYFAGIALFLVTSIFGLIGVYGGWTGLTGFASDPNLRVFQALEGEAGQTIVSTFWGVLVVLLAVIMGESALDSLQNGIGASVIGVTSRLIEQTEKENKKTDESNESRRTIQVSRVIVVVLNIPLIIVGLQRYEILRLFLITNMVTTCSTFPLILGFIKNDFLSRYHMDYVCPLSSIVALLALVVYGTIQSGGGFLDGIKLALWDQLYEWDFFLVALLASVFSTFLFIGLNYMILKNSSTLQVQDV